MNSKEIVTRLYLGILNRPPDLQGLNSYAEQLKNDEDILKVVKSLVESDEHKMRIFKEILNSLTHEFSKLPANSARNMSNFVALKWFNLMHNNKSKMIQARGSTNIFFVYTDNEKKERDSLVKVFRSVYDKFYNKIPVHFLSLSETIDYLFNQGNDSRNIFIVSGYETILVISSIKNKNSLLIYFDHGVASIKNYTYHKEYFDSIDYYFASGKIKADRIISLFPKMKNKVFVVGFPKLECLISSPSKEERVEYCKKMGLDPEKPIILFAPTWTVQVDKADKGILKMKKLNRIPNLFAIPHSGDYALGESLKKEGYKIHLLQENETISDHYPFVDILITDISSTAVEFARIGKPVICILEEDNIYSDFDSRWISPSGIPIIPHTNYEWKICKVCKTDEVENAIKEILSGKYEINTELVNLLCDCYGDEAVNKSLDYLIPIIENVISQVNHKENNITYDETIRNIYLGMLNREPDEQGLNAYKQSLINGQSVSNIIKSIKNSHEFLMKFHDTPHHMLYGGHIAYAYENPATVFIHIPKTAGQSLHWLFKQKIGENKVSPLFNNLYLLPANFAYTYDVIFGHTDYETVKLLVQRKEVKLVTFLRDPIKRLISLYKFWWAHDPEFHKGNTAVELANKYTIEEFFKAEEVRKLLWNDMFGRFMGYKLRDTLKDALENSFKDKGERISFINKRIIPLIHEQIEEYFYVGLQEQFNQDVCEMFNRLGFSCDDVDLQDAKVNITENNIGKPGFKKEKPSFEVNENVLLAIEELTELDSLLYQQVKNIRSEQENKILGGESGNPLFFKREMKATICS